MGKQRPAARSSRRRVSGCERKGETRSPTSLPVGRVRRTRGQGGGGSGTAAQRGERLDGPWGLGGHPLLHLGRPGFGRANAQVCYVLGPGDSAVSPGRVGWRQGARQAECIRGMRGRDRRPQMGARKPGGNGFPSAPWAGQNQGCWGADPAPSGTEPVKPPGPALARPRGLTRKSPASSEPGVRRPPLTLVLGDRVWLQLAGRLPHRAQQEFECHLPGPQKWGSGTCSLPTPLADRPVWRCPPQGSGAVL